DKNISFFWKYGSPAKGIPDDKFSVAWEGVYKAEKDGVVRFLMSGDDGYRLFVDGVLLGGDWGNHSLSSRSAFLDVKSGRKYQIRFEYFDNAGEATVSLQAGIMNEKLLEESLSGASHVVFCAGFDSNSEGEGFDRNFSLPAEQKRLIDRVASAHRNVTVVVNAGGGVDFSGWSENVSSVLMAWYPGQEGGTALAEILTGKVSPSGRLPVSIEKSWDDNPVHHSYYENAKQAKHVEYNEGIFVGYRGYDRSGISPEYPFGFGLSYTTFEYSDMSVVSLGDGKVKVELDVRNSGQMDASEVVQVYVSDCESSVKRPVKELKGYAKVFLRRGETRRVSIVLGPDAFAFYDVGLHGFRVEPGEFDIMAGGSSSDLPLSCRVYVGM
ncbi:MAG: glycoside hydrolase family 3 C-terminal domain-containing protein, partial [Bacteroidales bacterium]|nr:glycoside hydrolase family 3 C-terminal domain-containing protein [Bacteroidales bacterium]